MQWTSEESHLSHNACFSSNVEIAQFLVEKGSNIYAKDTKVFNHTKGVRGGRESEREERTYFSLLFLFFCIILSKLTTYYRV